MAKKIADEDLRLNIIVNGDTGRRQLLEQKRALDGVVQKQKELAAIVGKMEKDGTNNVLTQEYKSQKTALDELDRSVAQHREKLESLYRQQEIGTMTMAELNRHIKENHIALKVAIPGTEQWEKLNKELRDSRSRMKELADQSKQTKESINSFAGFANKIFGAFYVLSNLIGKSSGIIMQSRNAFLQYDEALVDAMKTTGLERDDVEQLSGSLSKIDTRTAQNELLGLVRAGGKLGISGEKDLLGFARAADMINVALSEDLGGDAEAAITAIGKMTDIFHLNREFGIEQAMLKVGSAINELGMASTANEGYIVDFSRRLAGIAPNADISIQKVLGLAATLDKYGQSSEMSATAIGQTVMAMFRRTETFAGIAGVSLKDFSELLETDVNEALLRVLEGMRRGEGGLASVTAAMEQMHLDGQRAATVLGTLSKNTEELRNQQEIANEAFAQGTSILGEFEQKNSSATARMEKLKKANLEQVVTIGRQLTPAVNGFLSVSNWGLGVLSRLVVALTKYRATAAALAVTVATLARWQRVRTAADTVATAVKRLFSRATAESRKQLERETVAMVRNSRSGAGVKAMTLLLAAAKNGLARNTKAARIALQAFWNTMKANPIGIVLAALGALVSVFSAVWNVIKKHREEAREAARAQQEMRAAVAATVTEAGKEKRALEQLREAVLNAASGSMERAMAIRRINEQYGSYLPNLLDEKASNQDVATALAQINAQLEAQIRLKGMLNAKGALDESLQAATTSAAENLRTRYNRQHRKNPMTDAMFQMMLGEMVAFRDALTSETATAAQKKNAAAIFKNGRTSMLFNPKDLIKDMSPLLSGVDSYNSGSSTLRTLYGVKKGTAVTTYDHTEATAAPVPFPPPGSSGGAGSAWSLGGDREFYRRKMELQEEFLNGSIATETEYNKEIQNLEIELLRKRILSGKDSGEERLKLQESLNEKLMQQRREDGDGVSADHLKALDDWMEAENKAYEDRKRDMQIRHYDELAAARKNGDDIQLVRESQAKELTDLEMGHLEKLMKMLRQLQEKGKDPLINDFDLGALSPEQLKTVHELLQKIVLEYKKLKEEQTSDGTGNGGENAAEKRHSWKEGTGKGDLFGVSQEEWEGFFDNLEHGRLGVDELGTALTAMGGMAQEGFKLASQAISLTNAKEKEAFKQYQKSNEKKRKSLQDRLDAGLMSQAQYDAEVSAMEEEERARQEELQLKQAAREKKMNIVQSIINTALGVTKTLAQWGVPAGIAPAAIMAAMGAAQTALIAAQPVTGAEEGGLIFTKRKQDGRTFPARLSPDKRGFIDAPTVLVGENGGEYVIPAEGLDNPTLRPLLNTMETARRAGTLRSLNFEAVYPAGSAVGRASGGFTAPSGIPAASGGSVPSAPASTAASDRRLVEAIELLNRRLKDPIRADVSLFGRNGILAQQEKYDRARGRGR